MNFKRNISLDRYTAFKIGGKARYFFEARNIEDLMEAIKSAKKLKLPFFILGGGANVLFSDKGFNGLVIKIKMTDFGFLKNKIIAEAGAQLGDLVWLSRKESLKGLEWAAGIPGTIGGAVYGNAQAFGNKISEIVESAEALDVKSLKIKKLSKKECRFDIKSSLFKKNKNLIILSVILKLKKGDRKKIEESIKEHLEYRKKHHPLNFPSAGSVFINIESTIRNKKILEKYPKLKEFNKKRIIHAGYLAEECGLKGEKIGGAQISEKHGNFIVNFNNAKAEDVKKLIKLMKREIKNKFGLLLKEEIQIINF